MRQDYLQNSLQGKGVSDRTNPFFYHTDTAFDEWLMLICTGQVETGCSHEQVCELFEGRKFPVPRDERNTESALEIVVENFL